MAGSLATHLRIVGSDFDATETGSTTGVIEPGDWQPAYAALRPRSRLGPLFGVTSGDLRDACLSLSEGRPVYVCGALVMKTIFDKLAAITILVWLLPVLIMISLAVKLTSPGPVLSRQTRVGQGGREFTMLKFRTMVDPDQRRIELGLPTGLTDKVVSDPRLTRVGRFLRRYGLDELPNLLCVVRGDMSLVGPRASTPREVNRYENEVRRRLLVKPGLTGLWQINGRQVLDWNQSVQLDLYYVENWSPALDFVILWRTVSAVMRHHSSAY